MPQFGSALPQHRVYAFAHQTAVCGQPDFAWQFQLGTNLTFAESYNINLGYRHLDTSEINNVDGGHNIIDLEHLANHRGSAFGDLGLSEQSTQQQFENDLSSCWLDTDEKKPVFIESESRRIGRVTIPNDIWTQMLNGLYLKIDMNINRRIKNLIKDLTSSPLSL